MRDLETGLGVVGVLRNGDAPFGVKRGPRSAEDVDPLAMAFEADLAAWLTWLDTAREAQVDERGMRHLELVYGAGWTAVCAATLLIPLLGIAAGVLSVVLLAATLLLGCVVTAPGPDWPHPTSGTADPRRNWQSLRPADRARLVRIINLSSVAARPAGAQLLLSELDEALTSEWLAGWPPLGELRSIVCAGSSGFIPFGSESLQRVAEPIR